MGGYASGAGVGLAIGEYGLGVDNLLSAIVVLSNGDIVEASDTKHSDLFWGIRGGGCNFGVLAELCMKLHPQQPDVYAFTYVFLRQHLETILTVFEEWLKVQTVKEFVQLIFSLGPDGTPCCVVTGVINGTPEEGEAAFNRFLDIGPVHTTHGTMPYEVFGTLADHFGALPGNKLMIGARFNKIDYPTISKAYDAWLEITKKAPESCLLYNFFHKTKAASVPVDATAYAGRHADPDTVCSVIWSDPEFSVAEAREACLTLKAIVSESSTQECQDSLGYVNYADLYSTLNETDQYARKLFGRNYPRLQEVKKKYDPEGVWNTWFAIRPAA